MKTKLTKKSIVSAINELYGLEDEDLGLMKFDGEYHWSGRVGACFYDTLAVNGNLSTWPLKRWLEDFHAKSEMLLGDKGVSLKEYIDSIDWDVELCSDSFLPLTCKRSIDR